VTGVERVIDKLIVKGIGHELTDPEELSTDQEIDDEDIDDI
jgi:hypothetical protein